MPHSLRVKIKNLRYKGIITDKDCDRLIMALDNMDVLDKIKAEIKEWYWQADKQAIAKDPCVVDAMIDLFIRTIDKYKAKRSDKE